MEQAHVKQYDVDQKTRWSDRHSLDMWKLETNKTTTTKKQNQYTQNMNQNE